MGAVLRTALRVCGFFGGVCALAVSAGCAGSSSHQGESVALTSTVQRSAQLLSGGSGHTSIRGVRVDWQHERDGHVCYEANPPRDTGGSLGSCIKRLQANEIAYAIRRLQKTRQLVIVGVKGPLVEKIYLRFPAKRWTPPVSRSTFFGYIPRGKVLSVVKVLKDGTRREFAVNQYSA